MLISIAVAVYALSLFLLFTGRDRLSYYVLGLGIVFHVAFLVARAWTAGLFMAGPALDATFLLPLILAVMAAHDIERSGAAPLVLAVLFGLAALFYPRGIPYLGPDKQTAWATVYFITDVSGRACLFTGALMAVLSLAAREEAPAFHSRLVWGFVLYTIAQVTGAIWCFQGWAGTFQWVGVHMESAATWCFFANYLHLQFLPAWTERRKAWYAVAGGILLLAFHLESYAVHLMLPRIGG